MKPYKVISLDMFQTLVDIQGRTGNVWKPILQERYSEERAAELGGLLLSYYYKAATTIRDSGVYWTSKEIYSDSFQKVFQQEAMEYDYLQAVDVLFAEHCLSELYEETEHFLQRITGEYQVCIVSDTDVEMLPDFYKSYPIRLFTSEEYLSYKNDSHNRMFGEVIAHYGVEPGQIIHIGDSVSDVLGAVRAGIKACWLNRNQEVWNHEVKPDYTVENLDEFYDLL